MKKLLILSALGLVFATAAFSFAKEGKFGDDNRNYTFNESGSNNTGGNNTGGNTGVNNTGSNTGVNNTGSNTGVNNTGGKNRLISAGAILCMRTAVEKRENSLIGAITTFHSGIVQALNTKKTDLIYAWNQNTRDAVRIGIKKAWTKFKASKKTLNSTLKTAEKSAWKAYKADIKTCKLDGSLRGLDDQNEGLSTIH